MDERLGEHILSKSERTILPHTNRKVPIHVKKIGLTLLKDKGAQLLKLSRSLCIAEKIECLSIFNSLECFPWKLLSYCTGPRNVLSYCTGPRKGVPGGTTFA